MSDEPSHGDLEALLPHRDFVGVIVWLLVLDEPHVGGIVQRMWLDALRSPPPKGALRASQGSVIRCRAAGLIRSARRRAPREGGVARPVRAPHAATAFERLTLHRQVVDAVLALEEPHRSAVLLRFYEERPTRQVAAIQGVSVATVRTRLRRARGLLRARFDRDYGGDRRAWCLALLPLALSGLAAAQTGALRSRPLEYPP